MTFSFPFELERNSIKYEELNTFNEYVVRYAGVFLSLFMTFNGLQNEASNAIFLIINWVSIISEEV